MTDKPTEEITLGYAKIVNLKTILSRLYGEELTLKNNLITIEYVKGHEPKFFRTGPLELSVSNSENCSYKLHEKKETTFRYAWSKAITDLTKFGKSHEGKARSDYAKEEYEALLDCRSKITEAYFDFIFETSLIFDKEASSNKVLEMNQFVGTKETWYWTLEAVIYEGFYVECHENNRTNGEIGVTVLKVSPKGFAPKTIILMDQSLFVDKQVEIAKDIIDLNRKIKKKESKKSGCLTPQYQQPDNFGVKPDYLNKDWLLGSANNSALAAVGIAR